MKKALAMVLVLLCLCLAGCAGDTVIYQELTRPEDSEPVPPPEAEASGVFWKTGLAILCDTTGSESAVRADYDVTVAAVLVDDAGIIRACVLDGAAAQMTFDETGAVTGDPAQPLITRQEENGVWLRRAEVLQRAAVGKTVGQLRGTGDWDERLFAAVEKAVANAHHLGAQEGEELRLAVLADLSGSASALATLADGMERTGLRLQTKLKVVTVTRGVADGQLRRKITGLFDCPVAQTLGMRTEGIVAFMCPEGHLHITAENCFVEILDPQTWSPLPPNKPGLLAVTDLVGTVMPHLRVMLNYMAELSDEPCPCGRTLPVLKHLRATAPGI